MAGLKAKSKKKKKVSALKIITLVLLLSAIVATFVFADYLFGEESLFEKWIAEGNVTNSTLAGLIRMLSHLLKTFQIVVLSFFAYHLIAWITKKSFRKSNRMLTIHKLLTSFLKYLVAIVALLFVLSAWGVNTTTLLASAGILGLVIGLGAQSLIADIIAGIFIVFEGSYQVGDIVVIDGWRGTVDEIGIRTTKIIDAGGNIKIINNSNIATVINQTKELSVAKCVMSISYDESLERVEKIISDNLDKIREKIPGIVDGPYYKGVTELGASSVNLMFLANCKEEDIYQVQRDMNRQFKLLFDKNDIVIPYPQIVVNQPEKNETSVSRYVANKADKFVEEQKQASSGLEKSNDE